MAAMAGDTLVGSFVGGGSPCVGGGGSMHAGGRGSTCAGGRGPVTLGHTNDEYSQDSPSIRATVNGEAVGILPPPKNYHPVKCIFRGLINDEQKTLQM